jgi:hypothetical protein
MENNTIENAILQMTNSENMHITTKYNKFLTEIVKNVKRILLKWRTVGLV